MVSFAKPSGNVLKAANAGPKKVDIALGKAKGFRGNGQENFKSALEMALESLDGLEGCLELHIITALALKELEVLLSGAKVGLKNAAALKRVNILTPLTDNTEERQSDSSGMFTKMFSDEGELQSLLRSSLLCQPGDYPAIKLEVRDGDTGDILSLDLQPRSVHTVDDDEEEECELMMRPAGGAGPHQLKSESTVNTSSLCQSLLTGGSLLARPSAAVFLSQTEREDNTRKVSVLHSELSSQARSLVLRSADPHFPLHLLTPCSHLSRPPTFLIYEALTATDLLPFPTPVVEDTEDDEEEPEDRDGSDDTDVRELLGRLPHHTHYHSSVLSSRRSGN